MQKNLYCSIRAVLDYFEIKIFLSNTYSGDVTSFYETKNSWQHFLGTLEKSQKDKKMAFQDFIDKIKLLTTSKSQLDNSEARLLRNLHKVLLCTRRAFNKTKNSHKEILYTNILEFPEYSELRKCEFFTNKRRISIIHPRGDSHTLDKLPSVNSTLPVVDEVVLGGENNSPIKVALKWKW
jgi:hypothetical protein